MSSLFSRLDVATRRSLYFGVCVPFRLAVIGIIFWFWGPQVRLGVAIACFVSLVRMYPYSSIGWWSRLWPTWVAAVCAALLFTRWNALVPWLLVAGVLGGVSQAVIRFR